MRDARRCANIQACVAVSLTSLYVCHRSSRTRIPVVKSSCTDSDVFFPHSTTSTLSIQIGGYQQVLPVRVLDYVVDSLSEVGTKAVVRLSIL
jgi:hypothetical protein